MDDSLEFSSQIVEEEDFFFDDQDDDFECQALEMESNQMALDVRHPESEDEHKSFKSLLAGPSTNKVGRIGTAIAMRGSNSCLGWHGQCRQGKGQCSDLRAFQGEHRPISNAGGSLICVHTPRDPNSLSEKRSETKQ